MNSALFFVTLSAYVGVVALLGYWGYRRTNSHKDYLLAGREAHPFVMAMSYGAAFVSTSAIVGFGGIGALYGMGLMWLSFMNIAFGIFIAFVFFGHRTRKIGHELDAHTFPELLGKRFGSNGIRVFVALVIFLFIPLYTGVVLISGARFLQEMMNMDYRVALIIFALVVALYVIFGGLKGVMYVDALMGSIMVVGMLSLLILSYYRLGGVFSAHRQLTELAPLVQERLPHLAEAGHQGWTVMPRFNSEWWWTLVSSLMLGVGIGALAQPQLAVRFMTVKSSRELFRATAIGAIFILCTVGSAYMLGPLSNVFFFNSEGLLAIEAVAAIDPAGVANSDRIVPLFISQAMPKVALYALILTLLSAAMSTLSSLFHVAGSSIGHDCYRVFSQRDSTLITRCGVVFGIVVSVMLGFVLPGGFIARGTAIYFGICAAAFLPTYIAALYSKKINRGGVWSSLTIGFAISVFGLIFLHRKESAALGICQAIFGRSELVSAFPWPFVDTMLYSLPLSTLALFVGSYIYGKVQSQKISTGE